MAYWGFKDLPRKIASNKVLHDKAFNIVENPKYDGYQGFFYFFHFLVKSPLNLQINLLPIGAKSTIMPNQQLAEELHKPVIRKIEKLKYTHLIKTIFGELI